MKLLYLTSANLADRLFIKDLVFNFKFQEKALLLHAPAVDLSGTRFTTKRLSSLFSEAMVYNNAFQAEQRDLFSVGENGLMQVHTTLIHSLLNISQLLLVGPVIRQGGETVIADPLHMVQAARAALEISELILFPANPLSPLGRKKEPLDSSADLDRLLSLYEEESQALQLAHTLRPARIASPVNYAL
ncbi:MAG: hypothetical protein EAZ89_01720 [Bacteroidetes bacterium]|nr:MAG: hypothetical protein EAZ89_01720 [Bacteroidota bacterium]